MGSLGILKQIDPPIWMLLLKILIYLSLCHLEPEMMGSSLSMFINNFHNPKFLPNWVGGNSAFKEALRTQRQHTLALLHHGFPPCIT